MKSRSVVFVFAGVMAVVVAPRFVAVPVLARQQSSVATPSAAPPSALSGSLLSVVDNYDVTKVITLKGSIRLLWLPPGPIPACLMIEVQDARGKPERWVVAGHPPRILQRTGWRPDAVKGPVTVSAYLPKPGSKAAETLATMLMTTTGPMGSPSGFAEELRKKDGRHAYGFEVTLADGTKLAFGEKH